MSNSINMENGTAFAIKEEPNANDQDFGDNAPDSVLNVPLKPDDEFPYSKPEYINLDSLSQLQSIKDPSYSSKEKFETWDTSFENVANIPHEHFLNDVSGTEDQIEAQNAIDADCKDDYSDNSSFDENELDLQCKVCKVQFLDDFDLNQHYKSRRLGDKSYKCCGCDKIFRDNTQLNVHSRKHTGEQPYECNICGKKFSVNGNLSKHMRIHTGERRFECDTCERKFTQFAHLEDHLKTHSGDRPFVCDFCNGGFKTKARLKKHQKSHEGDKVTKRSVPCPVCTKIMKSTKQLLSHMETHDDGTPNPFPCSLCGKSYKNLYSLNFHLKAHGGIRDFKCELCDKAFTNASHLRRHMNSHTGIRPYSCEICNRGFPSHQNLKRHMMTHTGEKPYSCDICKRGFLTLENLNRHKRTHTGEKPFSCNVCGRKFAHSTTAKEHMRIHTGDKPFVCTLCNKRFPLNKALYKHTREKHPNYFPAFKKANDLPPNQRRARDKIMKMSKELRPSFDYLGLLPKKGDLKNENTGIEAPSSVSCKKEPREADCADFNDIPSALNLQRVSSKVEKTEVDKISVPKDSKNNLVSEIVIPKVEKTDDDMIDNVSGAIGVNNFATDITKVEKTDEEMRDVNGQITFIKVEKTEYDYS